VIGFAMFRLGPEEFFVSWRSDIATSMQQQQALKHVFLLA